MNSSTESTSGRSLGSMPALDSAASIPSGDAPNSAAPNSAFLNVFLRLPKAALTQRVSLATSSGDIS